VVLPAWRFGSIRMKNSWSSPWCSSCHRPRTPYAASCVS